MSQIRQALLNELIRETGNDSSRRSLVVCPDQESVSWMKEIGTELLFIKSSHLY